MGREVIGKNILLAAELLAKHGPCEPREIRQYLPEKIRGNVRNLCIRVGCHGLATWELGPNGKRVYSIRPEWRDLLPEPVLKMAEKEPEKVTVRPVAAARPGIGSFWQPSVPWAAHA
jgi:hypothetical protein